MIDAKVPAYHLGVLRGFLAAHAAPSDVLAAAEALYAGAVRGHAGADVRAMFDEILLALDRAESSRPAERHVPPPLVGPPPASSDHHQPASAIPADDTRPKRKPWSDERRAVASERMKAMRASRGAGPVTPGEAHAPRTNGA